MGMSMTKYEEILEDIGLGKNEAKAYIALLELGSATAGQVAEKAKTHRPTIYDALEMLLEKGIVSFSIISKIRYYQATAPENLFTMLKDKEDKLRTIIPELSMKLDFSKSKSEAQVFYGVKAMKEILHSFLKHKEPILVYGIPKDAPNILKNHIPHLHRDRVPMKIPMLHIYNHDASERIGVLNKMPFTEARYLPQAFDSNVSTNICGDEVCLFLFREQPISIKIKDKKVAESYKKYFYLLWDAAIKPTA